MISLKDFWDYIFDDQISRDLDVTKLPESDRQKIKLDKTTKGLSAT